MPYEHFHHLATSNSSIVTDKDIFLVDMTAEPHPHYSQLMQDGIAKMLRQGKRTLIIHNAKWYAKWLLCNECGYQPQCDHCDIGIAYYQWEYGRDFGLCHICKKEYTITTQCPSCHRGDMNTYGVGVDQLAEWVEQTFDTIPLIVRSSTANSLPKIRKMMQSLSQHQIIIATSLARHRPDDISLDLAIITSADGGLGLPQYTAPSDTFYKLYDSFRYLPASAFVVQTHQTDHHVIRSACNLDEALFLEVDSHFREKHLYPPYGQIAVIQYRSEIESKVFSTTNKLYQELQYLIQSPWKKPRSDDIEIYATPPLIYKMYDKYRYHIIVKGSNIRPLLDKAYTDLRITQRKFQIDRMAREVG